jgi:replicative DNA helicase
MPVQVYDHDAEQAVLSCCLYSTTARSRAREHLSREDFYNPAHESVWVAMEELDAGSVAIDPTTVLSSLSGNSAAIEAMPIITTHQAVPDNVSAYAETVRGWAVRRRLDALANRVRQLAMDPTHDPYLLTSQAVTKFTDLRDTGLGEEVQSRLLSDLLAEVDEPYDWVINGLMERRDRLVLTGQEGLGKSFLARQVGIFSAAGLHPFTLDRIEPVRVQILDYENSWNQIKRGSRRLYDFADRHGTDLRRNIHVASLKRIDITRDRDLSLIHREVDVAQPDVIVVGPLYRLTGRAIQTDDEAAPVLAALDTLRDRGCSLIIEAHAGHGRESGEGGRPGERDLRPRGSSALLGWPEFGYGMRRVGETNKVRLVPWRGDREERGWPQFLRRSGDPGATHYLPDMEAAMHA